MRQFVSVSDGGVPELHEDEVINYTLNNARLQLNEDAVSTGNLYITTKRFIFIGIACLDIDIPYICLHAIARDTETYPEPCLYCQLGGNDEEQEEDLTYELHVMPAEEKDLFPLFEALSYAASINPDPAEPGEEDGDDDLIFNATEVELGAEQARRLEHWDTLLAAGISTGNNSQDQFEDADEDEEQDMA